MDSTGQTASVNGFEHAVGVHESRLNCDGVVRIYTASIGDAAEVLDLLRSVHAESPVLSENPFSSEKAMQVIYNLIRLDTALGLVAVRNGEIIGCMGAPQKQNYRLYGSVYYQQISYFFKHLFCQVSFSFFGLITIKPIGFVSL